MKKTRNELENECTELTSANENDIVEFTRKQEEASDEHSKLIELTQIVEQKGRDKYFLQPIEYILLFRNG